MKANIFLRVNQDVTISSGYEQIGRNREYIGDYGGNIEALPWHPISITESINIQNLTALFLGAASRPALFMNIPRIGLSPGSFFNTISLGNYLADPNCAVLPIFSDKEYQSVSIRQRSTYSEFPYRADVLSIDIQAHTYSVDSRNISVERAKSLHNNSIQAPDILGFWNYVTNTLYPYPNCPAEIIEAMIRAIEKCEWYAIHQTAMLKPKYKIYMGIEQEWLFLKEKRVVPASKVFLEVLSQQFGLDKQTFEQWLSNGRQPMNELFNATQIGTDGRRIIAETRSKEPYLLSVRNLDYNRKQVYTLLFNELTSIYEKVYSYGYDMRLGGGQDGECISSHFNFSGFKPTEDLIKLWNIFVGTLLQGMDGGARPDMLNPPDTFTLNSDDRRPNEHYGIINNRHVFDEQQIRFKSYPNGEKGFEWRVCPAVFLNRVFTYNIFSTMWWFILHDDMDFETAGALTLRKWKKVFGNYIPAWEFLYQTKCLSLARSPFDYVIKERKCKIRELVRIIKTTKHEKFFNETDADISRIREHLLDYIHKPIYFKLELQKEKSITVHPERVADLKCLLDVYQIDIAIKTTGNSKDYINSYCISGTGFSEKELFQLMKISCLINY